MLNLAIFRKLLTQVLSGPEIHTAVLSTLSGSLISYASLNDISSTKKEIRLIVGLSGEIWGETREDPSADDVGMAECEVS